MRIQLDYRPALRQRTGVGEYVHEVARALVASAPADESLILFSSSWKDRLSPDAVPGAATIDRRVPVRVLNFAWHRLEWPSMETVTGTTVDVAHATHPLLLPTSRAARLVTIYDLDFLDHPDRTRAEIRRDYPELAASHAARADQIVVISRHTAQAVKDRLGVGDDKITIAYPGAPRWTPRDREPATDGCVLFLGTLEPRKNLGVLLDAYERLLAGRRDVPPLVLAGSHTPDAQALIERTQRPPLAGRVTLPGYVDPAARRALFDRALVFVLPSHTEGFGMPAVEAMTVGVPVVAANRGALPEAVGAAGILVEPDDSDGFARAIGDVLDDSGRRLRMRDAGLAHVRQFTWDAAARQIRDAWHRAVARHGTRRG